MKTKNILILIIAGLISLASCKKVLEVDLPINKIAADKVYEKAGTAIAAITGVYEVLATDFQSPYAGINGIPVITGFLSDELVTTNGDFEQVYLNNVVSRTDPIWNLGYRDIIYRCNAVIEGVQKSKSLNDQLKSRLIGEAKFTRAFIHFYLTNLYGDIPLILGTDFKTNSTAVRTPKAIVYEAIVKDLEDAKISLTDSYLNVDMITVGQERIRPNKYAAMALLARVFLYQEKWDKAEQESTAVINNSSQYSLTSLNEVFLKNSKESIWQLQPNPNAEGGTQKNTPDGRILIPFYDSGSGLFDAPQNYIGNYVLSEIETGDLRHTEWIKEITTFSGDHYNVMYKYKVGRELGGPDVSQEYLCVLRLGEQYLIRAEARANLGKIIGTESAKKDVDMIRSRAGLGSTNSNDKEEMLKTIAHERYIELLCEGHRWNDLKRTGEIDSRMERVAKLKGSNWSKYKALLPIPLDEFALNPSLAGHQNAGYPDRK